jgi:hypothetical protein
MGGTLIVDPAAVYHIPPRIYQPGVVKYTEMAGKQVCRGQIQSLLQFTVAGIPCPQLGENAQAVWLGQGCQDATVAGCKIMTCPCCTQQ